MYFFQLLLTAERKFLIRFRKTLYFVLYFDNKMKHKKIYYVLSPSCVLSASFVLSMRFKFLVTSRSPWSSESFNFFSTAWSHSSQIQQRLFRTYFLFYNTNGEGKLSIYFLFTNTIRRFILNVNICNPFYSHPIT